MRTISLINALHRTIRLTVTTLFLATGGLSPALLASAQAQTSCPAGSFKLETVWYNKATANVISASSEAVAPTKADGPGRGAWWVKGDLCQHTDTGDVWISQRNAASADRSAVVAK